jgi:hypothetical protein
MVCAAVLAGLPMSRCIADTGGWVALDAEGRSTRYATAAEAIASAGADKLEIAPERKGVEASQLIPAEGGVALLAVLADGQVWSGGVVGLGAGGDDLIWSNRELGRVSVALAKVRSICRVAESGEGATDVAVTARRLRQLVADARERRDPTAAGAGAEKAPEPGDVVRLVGGGSVSGAVTELGPAGVVVESGGQKTTSAWSQIDRVDFSGQAGAAAAAGGEVSREAWNVEVADGSSLLLGAPQPRTGQTGAAVFAFTGVTGGGATVEIPVADCVRLVRVGGKACWLDRADSGKGVSVRVGGESLFPGGLVARAEFGRTPEGVPVLAMPMGASCEFSLQGGVGATLTAQVKVRGKLRAGEVVGLFSSTSGGKPLATFDSAALTAGADTKATVVLRLDLGREGTKLYVAPVRGLCMGGGVELVAPVLLRGQP